MKNVCYYTDLLIGYAKEKLDLDGRDELYVRNTVLDLVGAESYEKTDAVYEGQTCTVLVKGLIESAISAGIMDEDDSARVADGVMGAVSLSPKEVEERFSALYKKDAKEATEWLYTYSVLSDYVKKEKLDANPRFEKRGLIITINLAKPEFRDAKKAASGNSTKGGYPKCTICRDNEGFFGRNKRTLRTVSLKLGGQDWFWQFSPYGYFYQHGIAVNCEHTPMHVDEATFTRLMDFVDMFPHWFIGCNAALPRIGGSVLAHDHYQGGGEVLPLHKAKGAISFRHKNYPNAEICVLDWPGTAIRVTSKDRADITGVCELIRAAWCSYENKALGIIAEDEGGVHSAISPTVVKRDGKYEMTLILRNNVTTEEYPDGVFHAHPEFHVIKKESIGLIEAQGLFILPGRLVEQLGALQEVLVKGENLPDSLSDFALLYNEMTANVKSFTKESAEEAVKEELCSICERILQNTAVFKSFEQTAEFLQGMGFER